MSTWSVVGEALDAPASCLFPLSLKWYPLHRINHPSKKPTLSMMRWDERWKLFPRLLKKNVSKERKPASPVYYYFSIREKEGRRGGRKKSPPDWWGWIRGWGGVVVTGLTLTHLMPVYLFSPLLSLFQVSGKRGQGNTRIHYLSELCAALTRDLFVWLSPEFIYFLVLVCVKGAAKYRPPPNSTGD